MSLAGADALEPPPAPLREPGEKLASWVAGRLEADIIARGWPVGEVLGSEQQLRERYGVSRSVLREAVRLTEHHQVARMRRGPNGGLFVTAPDASPATVALVIHLEYVGLSLEDLMDARMVLEPVAAAAATERIGEDGIDRLRRLLDEEVARHDESGLGMQDVLHLVLAGLSGNPALELFVDVLTRLTARYAHTTRRMPRDTIHEGRRRSHDRHVDIVDAVVSGDASRAATVMEEHLRETTRWLADHRSKRPRQAPSEESLPAGTKLAELVASRIRDEIARRGWPVGQVLGSEADLLARYGISRAVLREAVRLLEYHAVARMRRGPGGGLVVTVPEPDAAIDTMALYLDYRGVSPDALRVVRDAIELGALGEVIARRDDPDLGARLEASMGPGHASNDFHIELAELSGNPVYHLFLRILTELWNRHTAHPQMPVPGDDGVLEAEAVHRRILQAVLDGDEGVARHRMRRHLEALSRWFH